MNPAEHAARTDAGRRGVVVGSPEDVIEHLAIQDAKGDEEDGCGAWWPRGEVPA